MVHLRGLMVVKIYCYQQRIHFFEAKPHRADTQPYGSRPKRQHINDNNSDDEGETYSEIQYQDAAFDSI